MTISFLGIFFSFISLEFHLFSDEADCKEDDDEEDVADHLGLLKEQGDQPDLPLVPGGGWSETFQLELELVVQVMLVVFIR